MEEWRAAAALVLLAVLLASSAAAPVNEHTALESLDGGNGCYYNFQHYGEGDRIMTNEPCLNCTCHNRMLMCYLRVCPFTKSLGQDCTVEKRADQCCPAIICPDVPVDLLTSTSTSSPAEYGSTDVGHLDKYGCTIGNKFYSEGSKVPTTPNKPCELCYCIRNMTACVMQECTLHIDGCTPVYHKDVCCPVRYSCDHKDEVPMLDDYTTTVKPTPGFLLTTTVDSAISQDCVHDEEVYADGALIKTDNACEHCYCMKGDIVCAVQECGTPMENEGKNCTALPPRAGQCCPDTYMCENDLEYGTTDFDESITPTSQADIELSTEKQEKIADTVSPDHEDDQKIATQFNEDTTTKTDEQSEVPIEEAFEGSGQVTPEEIHTPVVKTTSRPIDDEEKTSATIASVEESSTSTILTDHDTERNIATETESLTTPKHVKESEREYESTSTTKPIDSSVLETSTVSLSIPDESTAQTITQNSEDVPGEKDSDTTEKLDIPQTTLINLTEDVDSELKSTTQAPIKDKTEIAGELDISDKVTEGLVPVTESLDDKKIITETEQSTEKVERQGTEIPHHESENEIIDEYQEPAQILPHIPGEGDCLVDGVTYTNDSVIPPENKCQKSCRCVSSIVKCEKVECNPPPDSMMNCEPMYDSSDSCCPTYVCDHVKETIPPESDSQISHISTESYPLHEVVTHEIPSGEDKLDKVPSVETDQQYTPAVDVGSDHTVVDEYEKPTTSSVQHQPLPGSDITDLPIESELPTGKPIYEKTPEIEIATIKAPEEKVPDTVIPKEPISVTESEEGSGKLQPGTEKLVEMEPTTEYIFPDEEGDKHFPEKPSLVTESETPKIESSSESKISDSETKKPTSSISESATLSTQVGDDQSQVTDMPNLVTEEEAQKSTPEIQESKLETPIKTPEENIPYATTMPIFQASDDHKSPDEVQNEIVTTPKMLETDISGTDAPQKYTPVIDYLPTTESSKGQAADTERPKLDISTEYDSLATGSPYEPSATTVYLPHDFIPTDQVTQTLGSEDLQTDLPTVSVPSEEIILKDESTDEPLHLTSIEYDTERPIHGPEDSFENQAVQTEQPGVLENLPTTFVPQEGHKGTYTPDEQILKETESHDIKKTEQPILEDKIATDTPTHISDDKEPGNLLPESDENPDYPISPTPHAEIPFTSQEDISTHDIPKEDITIPVTPDYTSDEVTQSYTVIEDVTDSQKFKDVTPIVFYDGEDDTVGANTLKPESHVTVSSDDLNTSIPEKISHVTETSIDHTLSGEDIQNPSTAEHAYDSSSVPTDVSYGTDSPADFIPVDQDHKDHDFGTKLPEDQTSATETVSEESIPIESHTPEKVTKSESSSTDAFESITPSTEEKYTSALDVSPEQTPTSDDTRIPATPETEIPKEGPVNKDISATEDLIHDETTPSVFNQDQTETSKLETDEDSHHVTIGYVDSHYHTQLPVESETATSSEELPSKEGSKTDSPYVTSSGDESSESPHEYSTLADDTTKSSSEITPELSQDSSSAYKPVTESSTSITDSRKETIEDNTPATEVQEEKKDQLPTGEETVTKSCDGNEPCIESDKPLIEEHTPKIETTDIKSCNEDEPCAEDGKISDEEHKVTIDTTDVKICDNDGPCSEEHKPVVEEHTPTIDISDVKTCNSDEPCVESEKPSVDEHTPITDITDVKICSGEQPCVESDKPSVEEHTPITETTDVKLCSEEQPCVESETPSIEEHTSVTETIDVKLCSEEQPCVESEKPSVEEHTPVTATTDVKLCSGEQPCAESEKPSVEAHTPISDITDVKVCSGEQPCIENEKPSVEEHTTVTHTTDVKICSGEEPCAESEKPSVEEHTPVTDIDGVKLCSEEQPCADSEKPSVEEHTPVTDTIDVKLCSGEEPCPESEKPSVEEHIPVTDTIDVKLCNGEQPCAETEKPSVEEHIPVTDNIDVKLCNGEQPCAETDKPSVEEHIPVTDTIDVKLCNGEQPCAGTEKPSVEEHIPVTDTIDVKLCNGEQPCVESEKPTVEEHTPQIDITEVKSCNENEPCLEDDKPSVEEHTVRVDTTDVKICDGNIPCSGDDKPAVEDHIPKIDITDVKACNGDEPCSAADKPTIEEHAIKDTTEIVKPCLGDENCGGDHKPSVEEHTPTVDTDDVKLCNGNEPCTESDKPSIEENIVVDTTDIKACNGNEPCIEGDKPTIEDHTLAVDTTENKLCDGAQPCAGDNIPPAEEHTTKVDTTDIKPCNGNEPCFEIDKSVEEHTPKTDITQIKPCDDAESCTGDVEISIEGQTPKVDIMETKFCSGDEPCVEDNKPTVEHTSVIADTDEPLVDDHTPAGIDDVSPHSDQKIEGITTDAIITGHETLSSEKLGEQTTISSVLQESSIADTEIPKDVSSSTEDTKISGDEQTSVPDIIDLDDKKTGPEESTKLTTTAGGILDEQTLQPIVPQEDISETDIRQEEIRPDQKFDTISTEKATISPVPEDQTKATDISAEVTSLDSEVHVTPSDLTDETIPNIELSQDVTVVPDISHDLSKGTEVPTPTDTTEVDNYDEKITDTKLIEEKTPVTDESPGTELPIIAIEQTPNVEHSVIYTPVTEVYQPDAEKTDKPEKETSKAPDSNIYQESKPDNKVETPSKENDVKDSVDESQIPITETSQENIPESTPVSLEESEECKNGKCVHKTDESKPIKSTPNYEEDTQGCKGADCNAQTQTNIFEEGSGFEPIPKPTPVSDDKNTPQVEKESATVDFEKTTFAPIVTEIYHEGTTELSSAKEPLKPMSPESSDSQQGDLEEPTTPSILKSDDIVTEKILEIATPSQFANEVTELDNKPEIGTSPQNIDTDIDTTTKIITDDESENEIGSIPVVISDDTTEDKPKPVEIETPVKSESTTEVDEIVTAHGVTSETSSDTSLPDETGENIKDMKPETEIDDTSKITLQTTPSAPEYSVKDDSETVITMVHTEGPIVLDHTLSVSITKTEESTDKGTPTDFTEHHPTEQEVLVHLSTTMPLDERITTDETPDIQTLDGKKPDKSDISTEYDEQYITLSPAEITPSPADSKITKAEVESSQIDTDFSGTTQYSVDKITSNAVTQVEESDKESTQVPDTLPESHDVTTQYPKEHASTVKSTTEEDIGLNVIETETDAPYKLSDENIPHDGDIPEKPGKPVEGFKPDDEYQKTGEEVTTDSVVHKVTTIADKLPITQTTTIEKELTTLSSIDDEVTSSPEIELDHDVVPTKDSSVPEHEPSETPTYASPETVITESAETDVTTRKIPTVTLSSESQVTEYIPSKDEQPTQEEVTETVVPSLIGNENIPGDILRQPTTVSSHDVETSPVEKEDIPVHVSVAPTEIPVVVDEHLTEKTHTATTDDSSSHVHKITTVTPTELATVIDDLTSQQGSGEPIDTEKHEIDKTSTPTYKEEEKQPVTEDSQTGLDEFEIKLTTKTDDNIVTADDINTERSPVSTSIDMTTQQSQTDDRITKKPTISTDNIETTVSLIDNEIIKESSKDKPQPDILPVTDTITTLGDEHKPGADDEVSSMPTGEGATTVTEGATLGDVQSSLADSATRLPESDDHIISQTDDTIIDTESKPTVLPVTEKAITDKPTDEQEVVTYPIDTDVSKSSYTPTYPTLAPVPVTVKEEIDVITPNVDNTVDLHEPGETFVPTKSYDVPGTTLISEETSTQHVELSKIPIKEDQLTLETTSKLPSSDEITETHKLKDEDLGQTQEVDSITEVPVVILSSAHPDDSLSTQKEADDTSYTTSHMPDHKDKDATEAPTLQQTSSPESVDFVPITTILGIPTTEKNVVINEDTVSPTIAPDVSLTDIEIPSSPMYQEEDKVTSEDTGSTTSHPSPVTQSYNEPETTETSLLSTKKPDVQKPSHGVERPISKPEKPGKYGPSTSTTTTVELPSPEHDLDHQAPGYGSDEDYDEDQAFGPGTCRYGGKVYVSAQQIPRDDPCDFCFCFRSDIICLQQSCPPPIHGCHEEPISGFCCPRYECPVSMATTLNITTTTTTTTTTLPPHFLPHAYKGAAARRGCQIKGHSYAVGEVVKASSGPCLHCTCGGDGQMKCDPKVCTPEPMLRQMIAAAVSTKRRR